jgi:cytochrome c oxidase cbb3-type subunit 3
MVGLSRKEIMAGWRWWAGLSARTRIFILAGLGSAVLLLAWAISAAKADASLLRTDPDLVPGRPWMMTYAVDEGRGVFRSHCADCHGQDGRGRPSRNAPDLADKDWLYGQGDVSDIETVVNYGIRAPNARTWNLANMPAYGTPLPYPREKTIAPLSPGDIKDVIQFLRSIEGRPSDRAAAARGASIFTDRGGCWDCHSNDGHGDPAIGAPNLTDDIWLYGDGSDKSLFQSIAQGRAGVCPAWSGRLSPVRIREVSVYVYSLSHGGAAVQRSAP